MSQVKMELIWQHHLVLPFILKHLKGKVEEITPVRYIYLYGSRAKSPNDWTKLKGKDWDVLFVCDFPIVNTKIWTSKTNYYVDLKVVTPAVMKQIQQYHKCLSLYPVNKLPQTISY